MRQFQRAAEIDGLAGVQTLDAALPAVVLVVPDIDEKLAAAYDVTAGFAV